MRDLTKLAGCGGALALVLVLNAAVEAGKPGGGPKPVTQACALDGDATGGGSVGITASSRGPLTMTIKPDTQLATTFEALGAGTYDGSGRVLKKQGRLDYWFDSPADPTCRPLAYGEEIPPVDPDVCCYELLLLNGVYYGKLDTVVFGSGTEAQLVDYCANQKISPDGATANLVVNFVK